MPTDPTLSYDDLKSAVASSAAAFRLTQKLEAVSPKVFPPTYEGGKYAKEDRYIAGYHFIDPNTGREKPVPCVLLDSVPSQANRMELALQEAWEGGQIKLPVVFSDFTAVDNPGVPKVTSLQAPHRIADAILRDSSYEQVKFRLSDIGKELDKLSNGYATPLLRYAPHCLVFGMWDSTGPRGGLGVKFARAIVSEIIGVNAVPGVATGSRIDPLNIRANSGVLYKAEEGWTLDQKLALKKGQEAIKLGTTEKKKGDGSPAEANHGNIPPQLVFAKERDENGRLVPKGGFTIDFAEQTTVLSLPALRRLRFPMKRGDKSTPDIDVVARTYLGALSLLGATLAIEAGYDLRSRCILRAKEKVRWELLGKPGETDKLFTLDRDTAIKLYNKALETVQEVKLPIQLDEIKLTPSADLVTIVKKSMELAAVEAGTGD